MIDEPDLELILAAQSGDHEAMTTLLADWNDPVFGFLMRLLKNRADAEDAAQETFLRVVKGLPNYQHCGKFRAWIFRIARNQAALTAKRRKRLEIREAGVEPTVLASLASGVDDGLESSIEYLERLDLLRNAIAGLPESEREVVTMRLDGGLKFCKISEILNIPLNTALGRMRNATKRLRVQLTRRS